MGRLGDYIEVIYGKQPKKEDYREEGIPFIRITEFTKPIQYKIQKNEKFVEINEKDILLSVVGTVGKTTRGLSGYISSSVALIKIKDENILNRDYLYYFLKMKENEIDNLKEGNWIKRIKKEKIGNIEINLPSIEEQEKIVKILDQVYENINWDIEDKIKNLKELKRTAIDKAIRGQLTTQDENESAEDLYKQIQEEKQKLISEGKLKVNKKDILKPITKEEIPFDIPFNWKWCRLGDIGDSLIGLTYSPNDISDNSKDIIVLRSVNIQNDKLDLSNLVRVNKKVKENIIINKNDILICSRNGSKNLIGKSTIIDKEIYSTFGAFMTIYRSKYNKNIQYVLLSNLFKSQLMVNCDTTTINQITQSLLRNIMIPLPPIEEQDRIVEILAKIDTMIDTMIDTKEDNKKLLDSLLNTYL